MLSALVAAGNVGVLVGATAVDDDADIVQRATADAVTVTISSLDFDFDEETSKRCHKQVEVKFSQKPEQKTLIPLA